MKFGIAVLLDSTWAEAERQARTVEDAGFDVLMTGDHMRNPWRDDAWFLDGWTVLAGWALTTRTVRLAMLVSNVIYRNPALLAQQAVAVDQMSNGRLDLGIGTGIFDTDHAMAGVPPWSLAERVGRTTEVVEIADRLLRGVFDDYEGRWYSVHRAAMSRPVQQPRPPIVVAANHPKMLRLAAASADTWNTWGGYDIDATEFLRLTAERVQYVDRACAEIGRDPSTLTRSALVHRGAFDVWRSTGAFLSTVEQFSELGFTELIFYWPTPEQRAVFDEVVADVVPGLRS